MDNYSPIQTISELNETNIKEELYILYLEIKGEISKRCIEINKSKFEENIAIFKIKTLINYLKEIIYILLINKFEINLKNESSKDNKMKDNNTYLSTISQLENEIKKYQSDIRHLIKKQFQYKIQKDAMEIKINTYIEMEKEYDLLKEKVKYEEGRFLNNDRKDNEIIILREENSNLKKEIIKNDKISKIYELKIKNEQQEIKELKEKLNQINKKMILLETTTTNHISINNNFSTIHNNSITNGRTTSRWSRKKEKHEIIPSNNTHLISHGNGNNSFKKNKKIKNTKYSKLEMKGIGNLNERTLSRGNSNSIIKLNNSKKKKKIKGVTTIDNNSIFSETYNRILNSLLNCKINNSNSSFKKTIVTTSHKKNSISMCVENSGKTEENVKNSSHKNSKHKSGKKHKIYHKITNVIPNSKFPLTSKHFNKNLIPTLPQKYFIKNNSSFINVKGKTKESLHVE